MTVKIWDMSKAVTKFEDDPITIFDHRAKIVAADILTGPVTKDEEQCSLATLDLNGVIYIRTIKLFIESRIMKFEKL